VQEEKGGFSLNTEKEGGRLAFYIKETGDCSCILSRDLPNVRAFRGSSLIRP